jgi:hypothetical protein
MDSTSTPAGGGDDEQLYDMLYDEVSAAAAVAAEVIQPEQLQVRHLPHPARVSAPGHRPMPLLVTCRFCELIYPSSFVSGGRDRTRATAHRLLRPLTDQRITRARSPRPSRQAVKDELAAKCRECESLQSKVQDLEAQVGATLFPHRLLLPAQVLPQHALVSAWRGSEGAYRAAGACRSRS